MKRLVFWQLFVAALLLTGNSHAQSIKDLFNKENIEKAVNAVTGKSTADMTGTWSYTGSAIEFESDNLLQKAGGSGGVPPPSRRKETGRTACQSRHQSRANVIHIQRRQHIQRQSRAKEHEGKLLLRCIHPKGQLEIRQADRYECQGQRYLHNYGPAVRIGQATETDNLPLQQKQQLHSEEYRLAGQQLRRNDARILITETVTTTSIQQKNPASTEQCLRDFFI